MKKTLSVLLSVLLLLGVIAPIAIAADTTRSTNFTANYTVAEGSSLTVTGNISINSGVTVTVNSGGTLVVASGYTLTIEPGAKLVNKGNVSVAGTIVNKGSVTGTAGVVVVNSGIFYHEVNFASYADANEYSGVLKVKYCIIDTLDPESFDFTSVGTTGQAINVPNGMYLVVQAHLDDAALYSRDPKYGKNGFDDAREAVYFNGAEMPYTGASHTVDGYNDVSHEDYHGHYTKVGASGTVTYQPISFTNSAQTAKYFDSRLTRYTVMLPSKDEAYTVITNSGATGAYEAKAGESVSFYVKVGEGYTQSAYKVYAYDSLKWVDATTDEIIATATADGSTGVVQFENGNDNFGYNEKTGLYTIKNVQSNYKVIVVGVISDRFVDIFQSVIDLIQRLFNTFKDVFAQMAELFKGLGIGVPAAEEGGEG